MIVTSLKCGLHGLMVAEGQDLLADLLAFFVPLARHDEDVALEALRDYQFSVRANPKSGFWSNHKAAMKSMCAFGDGWMFIEETHGERVPFRYEYMPLPDCYPALGPDGQPNRMFRVFSWSCEQAVRKFGKDKVSKTTLDRANDPKLRHEKVRIMHAVKPRDDSDRAGQIGARGVYARLCFAARRDS